MTTTHGSTYTFDALRVHTVVMGVGDWLGKPVKWRTAALRLVGIRGGLLATHGLSPRLGTDLVPAFGLGGARGL